MKTVAEHQSPQAGGRAAVRGRWRCGTALGRAVAGISFDVSNHIGTHTKPSAPQTMNAARHPYCGRDRGHDQGRGREPQTDADLIHRGSQCQFARREIHRVGFSEARNARRFGDPQQRSRREQPAESCGSARSPRWPTTRPAPRC